MSLVFFIFNVFWTATLFYFLNWNISVINLIISFFVVLIYWYLRDKKNLLKYILSFVIIFGAALFISKNIYDLSGDGQSYHQETIIQIALGWNPLKEWIVPDVWDSTHAVWMNHFPRFSWIVHGLFYKIFNNLEMSKGLNILLLVANFLVALAFLKRKFKDNFKPILLSLLAALNPVSLSQINTFCVDTQMASLFTLLMWNIFIFLDKNDLSKNDSGFSIILILAILFNVKLSSLAYLFIIFILILIYLILIKNILWKRWLTTFILGGILGIFVLGFDPYVTNTIKFGHPFYPIYTKNNVVFDKSFSPHIGEVNNLRDFMIKTNSPYDFLDKNWWWKFWRSIFSESSNVYLYSIDNKNLSDNVSKLKFPFSINRNELGAFIDSDVRVGGFGVWFSGAVLLSIILTIGIIIKKNNQAWNLLFFDAVVLIMAWMNPESWWARYVPFVWLIPVMTIYFSLKINNKYLKIGAWILSLVLMINIFLILGTIIPFQINQTKFFATRYKNFSKINEYNYIPVKVDFVTTRSLRIHYFENNIGFVESKMESGVWKNYFLKNLNPEEIQLMEKNYKEDTVKYEYVLKDDISNTDLVELAKVFKRMEKVPLIREKKIRIGS